MSLHLPATLAPGRTVPLGARCLDGGVNVAVWSSVATRIELCVFDTGGARELRRLPLHGPEHGVFHGFLPGAGEGLVYGLRAHGPYAPEQGHRCNPHKLLLDPYAREIVGRFRWDDLHHGYTPGHPDGPRTVDTRDNALSALKARVRAPLPPAPSLGNRPRYRDGERVILELHARGFSMQLPALPEPLRGRIDALAHPLALAHFRRLGVTTLSLLPLHYALSEAHLARTGLSNYWGYSTLGFFCLDPRFGPRGADAATLDSLFRDTVATLHDHGIEVLLDVVFNHTAEGDEHGPTLSFRGFDNAGWYRLREDDRSRHENHSGCGNTLNVAQPMVTRFVLDSLRHAMTAWGVDGFRFDLATALGRTRRGFEPDAPFFVALNQDPLLAEAVLVAEPWDSGPDGWQTGRFPAPFHDWNDRFRDAVRGYWLGRPVTRGEFARRVAGSSDLFHRGGRAPTASINYLTAHDGFTLADVVSHSRKHNAANGEDGRDGRDGELCGNFGVEGPSDDPAIGETRCRVRRAMLATLLLAQGTPMLCAGDELGNSQGGNNNAYCQDNPTGWLDWTDDGAQLVDLIATLTRLRRDEPLLRHPQWFVENPHEAGEAGVIWRCPHGQPMQVHDWHDASEHALACQIVAGEPAAPGLLLLFNPDPTPRAFVLPGGEWNALFSSADVASCRSQLAGDRGIGHVSVASKLAPTTAHATAHASSTQTSTAASSPLAVPAHSLLLLRGHAAASKALP